MRKPRSVRMPPGQPGVWHVVSRCVRRSMLLEAQDSRLWLSQRLAAWLEVCAVDLLGYALMGNHIHLVLRTRPDRSRKWSVTEVRRRMAAMMTVTDGLPSPGAMRHGDHLSSPEALEQARATLAHPGAMLRAVKEGFARRLNHHQGAAGHVWESRYHDTALIDAGGVLACLVYVDLNPFRAGLVDRPSDSAFCSARHRRGVDMTAPDADLGQRLVPLTGHPLLDTNGRPQGQWPWTPEHVAELTTITAEILRTGKGSLPSWAAELLPRLGLHTEQWTTGMAQPGRMAGNVLGSVASRRARAGSRMESDKSGLFTKDEGDPVNE